jgi:hypothetical protein
VALAVVHAITIHETSSGSRDGASGLPCRTPAWTGKVAVLYSPLSVVGGGFLRTGCGPGPLEPDLDNPSEGNTSEGQRPHPHRGAAVLVCGLVA